jgi:hypothetical protein
MDRAEHLQWCKDRAMEYANRGELTEAVASITSDLTKHPETDGHAGIQMGVMLRFGGLLNTPHEVEKFINGFN